MFFWIFMLLMDLLLPLTMIGFGKLFYTSVPKDINSIIGYRSTMSMKNKNTWEFAHRYSGRLWFQLGLVLLPISIIPLLFVFNKNMDTIGIVGAIVCFIQLIPFVGTIIFTEIILRKTFDKNGVYR